MSRCFPFSPEAFASRSSNREVSIKLQKENDEIRTEKRKLEDKKRSKKEHKKEHRHKDKKLRKEKKSDEHHNNKPCVKAQNLGSKSEQLEKSDITEEHDLPSGSLNSVDSSNKRKRQDGPVEPASKSQKTTFRIRLPLKKHSSEPSTPEAKFIEQPAPGPAKDVKVIERPTPCHAKEAKFIEQPKSFPVKEVKLIERPKSCPGKEAKFAELPKSCPAKEVKFIEQTESFSVKEVKLIERPKSSPAKEVKFAERPKSCPTKEVKLLERPKSGALKQVKLAEQPKSCPAKEVKLTELPKPCPAKEIKQPKSCPATEAASCVKETVAKPISRTETVTERPETSSRSKRKEKRSSKSKAYKALIEDWVPPSLVQCESDGEDWLFGSRSRSPKRDCGGEEVCRPSWPPRAMLLPEAGVYALPYVLPY